MTERLLSVASAPFEAARRLANLPEGHPARRLHGHGFMAHVRAARASVDGTETLTAALKACVGELDYRELNEFLAVPSDENLARWVRDRLGIAGVSSLGIQSTQDQGVDLDAADHAHVWRRFRFEAAHRLPNVPEGHPCGRMHGHGFEVVLHVDQTQDGAADRLDRLWAPFQNELHHACLNDLPGLENPTSERLSDWLWQRITPQCPALSWVTVYETVTAGCHYDGHQYRIWKEQRFEAAVQFPQASADDPRRRLHGHSYRLRLHLTAPLDMVLGWTVDYGDVKRLFTPVYQQLDHHRLDTLPGLAAADPGSLIDWIRDACAAALPELDRIDLHATPGCGAILCWGDREPALPG